MSSRGSHPSIARTFRNGCSVACIPWDEGPSVVLTAPMMRRDVVVHYAQSVRASVKRRGKATPKQRRNSGTSGRPEVRRGYYFWVSDVDPCLVVRTDGADGTAVIMEAVSFGPNIFAECPNNRTLLPRTTPVFSSP